MRREHHLAMMLLMLAIAAGLALYLLFGQGHGCDPSTALPWLKC